MMTQPCLIRKNTPELRRKLEELGLTPMNIGGCTLDAHNYDGRGNHKTIDEGTAIITYLSNHYGVIYDIDSVTLQNRFDCGTNEDLFFALAALRDDTDRNQWFVSNYFNRNMQPDEWCFCTEDDYKNFFGDCPYIRNYDDYHKATVEELLQHFNQKQNHNLKKNNLFLFYKCN